MYCLDTDLIIAHMRGIAAAKQRIDSFQKLGTELAITTITLCELFKGVYLSERREHNKQLLQGVLERTNLLTHTSLSCSLYGRDAAHLQKMGKPTQQADLMIASICKAHNAVLVTRNIRDFQDIPGLRVEKW